MSVADFNLLGSTQIANIGSNRSAVSASSVTSASGNTNLAESVFANLLNGSPLSATAQETTPEYSLFGQSPDIEIIAGSISATDPIYNILPVITAKLGLGVAESGQGPELSGLPIVTPGTKTGIVIGQGPELSGLPIVTPGTKTGIVVGQGPELSGLPIVTPGTKKGIVVGQGPEPSGLPIVPDAKKNPIITSLIPGIIPGERPDASVQNQASAANGKSTNTSLPQQTTPVSQQQGLPVNTINVAQVLTGAAIQPVKNELVGPAASRVENRRASSTGSLVPSSVNPVLGQNIASSNQPVTNSQPNLSASSGVVQSGQQALVTNNVTTAAVLNNPVPVPLAITPIDTSSIVQSRASDFGFAGEPEVGSSTSATKSTTQSSIAQNSAAPNSAAAAKIGAETVSKFAARLAMRAVSGATKFEMRLDPPQLGRIEVRMEMTSDNRVQAIMIVESPEVLQDMQKGADSLRRALMREGFDLGSNDLEFQLEQESDGSGEQPCDSKEQVDQQVLAQIMSQDSTNTISEIDTGYGYLLMSNQRIDIKA